MKRARRINRDGFEMCRKSAFFCALLIGLAWILNSHALANDTTAELATGGLVFTRTNDVEMQSEELYVSTQRITIRYDFYNHSKKDIITHVAFPLPDLSTEEEGSDDTDFAIPSANAAVDFLGFKTTVDGQEVQTEFEQRVFRGAKEYTSLLKELGIPLNPIGLRTLSGDMAKRLEKIGLVKEQGVNSEVGAEGDRQYQPRWSLKTTFYWEQRFPARAKTVILHQYQPSLGGTVSAALPSVLREERAKYCTERSFQEKARRGEWKIEWVSYILATGNNWSGPIRNFRLVVDKGSPQSLVSFCGDHVRKINSTQFEMRASNFRPGGEDLSILFLSPARRDYNISVQTEPNQESTWGVGERSISSGDQSPSDDLYYVANTEPPDAFLSLRTVPSSTNGKRLLAMPNGTLVRVLHRNSDGWWYVRAVETGLEGWALSHLGNKEWIVCCTRTDSDTSDRSAGALASEDPKPREANSGAEILKAPFPSPDDHSCSLYVNGKEVICELVLYLNGRGLQFNNDDSGRMVIFEGRARLPGTTPISYVTLANVEGQPAKTQVVKVRGQCTARADRTAKCQAKASDGRIFEGTVQLSRRKSLTCSGIFEEYPDDPMVKVIKLVRHDTFSAVKSDNYVCYVPWGGAGHSPFKGKCADGEFCQVEGIYRDHVGKVYVLDTWDAERQ
jgi:hypothetical protein